MPLARHTPAERSGCHLLARACRKRSSLPRISLSSLAAVPCRYCPPVEGAVDWVL